MLCTKWLDPETCWNLYPWAGCVVWVAGTTCRAKRESLWLCFWMECQIVTNCCTCCGRWWADITVRIWGSVWKPAGKNKTNPENLSRLMIYSSCWGSVACCQNNCDGKIWGILWIFTECIVKTSLKTVIWLAGSYKPLWMCLRRHIDTKEGKEVYKSLYMYQVTFFFLLILSLDTFETSFSSIAFLLFFLHLSRNLTECLFEIKFI